MGLISSNSNLELFLPLNLSEAVMSDTERSLLKILKVFPVGHRSASCPELLLQREFKYLSEELLIKLAYPATKYQCVLLRV